MRDVRAMLRKAGAAAVIESFSGSTKRAHAPKSVAPVAASAQAVKPTGSRVGALSNPERSAEPAPPTAVASGLARSSPIPRRSQTRRRVARPAGPPAPALAS
jgi:hypothetical protein